VSCRNPYPDHHFVRRGFEHEHLKVTFSRLHQQRASKLVDHRSCEIITATVTIYLVLGKR
jgi:hypothetical protein